MDDDSRGTTPGACPHVDRNDHRCGSRFSLGRIDQAFCVCFGAFHGCPMYHRINTEQTDERRVAEVTVTIAGNGIELPLRATGT